VAAGVGAGASEVVIIAGAAEVRQWAKDRDLTLLDDPGGGLNQAAVSAAIYAAAAEAPWVVLHADLPLVTGNALRAIVAAAGAGPVIAPSYDGALRLWETRERSAGGILPMGRPASRPTLPDRRRPR